MSKRFVLAQLNVPLIVAPMAGGPSTPELAAAITNGGGMGYIAGGLLPARPSRRTDRLRAHSPVVRLAVNSLCHNRLRARRDGSPRTRKRWLVGLNITELG